MIAGPIDPRVPPNDPEAERAVIAAVLNDAHVMPQPAAPVARALDTDTLSPDDFYFTPRGNLWRAIQRAHVQGLRPDVATLKPDLNERELAQAVECVRLGGTGANVEHFADRVRDAAHRRRALLLAQRVTDMAHDGTDMRRVEALALEVAQVASHMGAAASNVAHAWRPIEDALTEPDPDLAALWPGLVFRGALSLFAAMPKTGKTWLLIAWIAELVRGGTWLGSPPLGRSARVLLVTEEPLFILKAQARMFGIEHNVDILTLDGVAPGTSWPALVSATAERAVETGAEVLMFDTISTLAGMEDENSASDVNAALRPLLLAARTHDLAVVGVHHAAKSGGIRGSTVFEAVPDVLVEVGHGKTKRQRVLTVRSRLQDAPEDPVTVEWLPPMGEVVAAYRIVGEGPVVAAERETERDARLDEQIVREVEQAVAERGEPIVAARIVERIGSAAGRIRGRLAALVREGRLARTDGPGSGSPYRYGLPNHATESVPEDEAVPNLSREPVQPVPTCPSPVPCGSGTSSPNLSNLSRGAVSPRAGTGASSGTLPLRATEPEAPRGESLGLAPPAPARDVDPAVVGRNPDGSRRRRSPRSAT